MTRRPSTASFACLRSDDVRAMSVMRVRTIADLRSNKMGGTRTCGTCGSSSMECIGHFGHIELPLPVPHPLFPKDQMTALAVPPTRMRLPNAEHDAPLTALLHRILRAIDRYNRCQQGAAKVLQSATEALQAAVVDLFTSASSAGAAGLCARMRGKQGTLRQTLMGWRVNSCARAVVAPDPCLAPWEVGVPQTLATELGLRDGCSVVLNRQPSLHRGAMMGHVVRIRPKEFCFTVSPTVTPPYNADFDGDEMNLHVCSAQSSADARFLIGVEHTLVSPSSGAVAVRPVQDACLSRFLRDGLDSAAQRTEILYACETLGSVNAARQMHVQQLQAHAHMMSRGFSVGLDDFLAQVPVASAGRFALGDAAAAALDAVPMTNRIRQMVAAGSKGSVVNLAQLYGCVGYQTVQGRAATPPPGSDMTAFVAHSFVQGMTEDEFWMHACAAREGMIQTAVKTADAGYIMRRMVKTLENVAVAYDDTVRTGSGAVVQFVYGGDGIDPVTSRYTTPRRVDAGEAVGVVCAQAVGEKLTQLTLDTFHRTGIAFRHGIQRVKALLDASPHTSALLRGADRPYRLLRYDIAQLVVQWEPVSSLPPRAALEMRLRGMVRTPTMCGTLHLRRIEDMGLMPWHVAARVREQCPCVCDGVRLYTERVVSGTTGPEWAGETMVDGGSVALGARALTPNDTQEYPSEPPAVATCLGIEAAAEVLRRELAPYMQGVDHRHLMLLSDAMTHTGHVLGATRTGMRCADAVSVLGRACFETGPQVLAAAAVATAVDPLHAASSRLALGLVPRLGCHSMGIVHENYDTNQVPTRTSFMDAPPAKRGRFCDFMNP